jgi:negative regulator of sigma E activity
MATEPNRHDDAIDQVLAAMRHAAAPEGMDARILARLHQQQSASHAPVSPSVTSAWWRGAFTGAAAALVSVAALLLIQHDLRNPSTHPQTAQSNSGTHGTPNIPSTHAVIASVAGPCSPPTLLPHLK